MRLGTLGFNSHCFSYLLSKKHTQCFFSVVCQLSSSFLRVPTGNEVLLMRAQQVGIKQKSTKRVRAFCFMAPTAGEREKK